MVAASVSLPVYLVNVNVFVAETYILTCEKFSFGRTSWMRQCILKDTQENMWFGKREGGSKFDYSTRESFPRAEGLISINVFSMAFDTDGLVWVGISNGILQFNGTTWTNCQTE